MGYHCCPCPKGGAHDFTTKTGFWDGEGKFHCSKCGQKHFTWKGRVIPPKSKSFGFPKRAKTKEEARERMAKSWNPEESAWSYDPEWKHLWASNNTGRTF